MPAPEPEWRPDPTGRFPWRYWDGRSWTSAVAKNGVMSTDEMPPPPLEDSHSASMASPTSSGWEGWTRFFQFFQPSVRGRALHPLLAIGIIVLAVWLVLSFASAMKETSELKEYYDTLYD